MDSNPKGIAWVGNVFQKLEAMRLEVEDIAWQDGLKYMENQLQTVSVNVKQFCSEFVQDVFPEISMDVTEDATYDPSAEESSRVYEMLKEDIDEDHFEQDLCNATHQFHLCSMEPTKVSQSDLSLEDTNDDEINEKTDGCFKENLEEKQPQLEMSANIESKSSTSSASTGIIESKSFAEVLVVNAQSSNSVEVVDTTSCDPSRKLIRKSDSLINDVIYGASPDKAKLDESCVIIDSSELFSVSQKAEGHRSYKRKLKDVFSTKNDAPKQNHLQHAASYQSPDFASIKQNEEDFASSSFITSNPDEFCESDWEIV